MSQTNKILCVFFKVGALFAPGLETSLTLNVGVVVLLVFDLDLSTANMSHF
jgi:hypothetical protein